MYKKLLLFIGIPLLLLLLIYFFRFSILSAAGNFLIRDEAPVKTDCLFVLSGAPQERTLKAAELFQKNFCKKIICTGANHPQDFAALGMNMTEGELTEKALIRLNVPDSLVDVLKEGTSTDEEAIAILNYCKKNSIKEIEIVSSKFHARRVRNVFAEKFCESEISIHIVGAPSTVYHENVWWENEYGLLAVNNEWVKLFYYLFK